MGCVCPRVAPISVALHRVEQADTCQVAATECPEKLDATFTAAAVPEAVPKLKLNSMSLSSGSDNAGYHTRSCSVRTKGSLADADADDDFFEGSTRSSRRRSQSQSHPSLPSPSTRSDRRPSMGSQGTTLRFKLRNSPRDPANPSPHKPLNPDQSRRRSSVVFVSASSEQMPISSLADLVDPGNPSNGTESISDELNSMLQQTPMAVTYNDLIQHGSLVMQCGGWSQQARDGLGPPSDPV
eukprot:GGOE01005159.1.p1 GENE.GGOE01005159.1~~GGOE01005159.1.p1  ORF type:complete len:240 (+),score=21.90 GGOE01005159.1:55-774(+)